MNAKRCPPVAADLAQECPLERQNADLLLTAVNAAIFAYVFFISDVNITLGCLALRLRVYVMQG